jgi:hypothetical protein
MIFKKAHPDSLSIQRKAPGTRRCLVQSTWDGIVDLVNARVWGPQGYTTCNRVAC